MNTNTADVKVFVEKDKLKFNDQGIASIALVEGQEYFLYCFALGNEGSNYELSIIEPIQNPFRIYKTIDNSNEERGKYAFTVSDKEEYTAYLSYAIGTCLTM